MFLGFTKVLMEGQKLSYVSVGKEVICTYPLQGKALTAEQELVIQRAQPSESSSWTRGRSPCPETRSPKRCKGEKRRCSSDKALSRSCRCEENGKSTLTKQGAMT